METYYLIDFENVHNDGITNIENMTKSDHVHHRHMFHRPVTHDIHEVFRAGNHTLTTHDTL